MDSHFELIFNFEKNFSYRELEFLRNILNIELTVISFEDAIEMVKNLVLYCSTCNTMPIIKPFNSDFKKAFVSCNCSDENKIMSYEEILDKYLLNLQKENHMLKYVQCDIHKKKFQYFCENEELHMCENCYINHNCHIKYDLNFQNIKNDIIEKLYYIYKVLSESEESFIALKKIIFYLTLQYHNYPNYNIIENINNFYWTCLKKEEEKKSEKGFDINLFYPVTLDFTNKQLDDISFLSKKDLKNLTELNLQNNKLDDKQINIFYKLKLKNLKILNLARNHFSSYQLLIVIENLSSCLEDLDLNTNRLTENVEILNEGPIRYYSIQNLNLSNGVFSNNTINYIKNLKFKNLKNLDLSSNGLNNLSFTKKINFGKGPNTIESLILDNNEISINQIKYEDLEFLNEKYERLKLLILEKDYPIEYKIRKHLRFKIICFDDDRRTEYFLDKYDEYENQKRDKTMLDYQQFYDK